MHIFYRSDGKRMPPSARSCSIYAETSQANLRQASYSAAEASGSVIYR